jgi:hypothetical protein
MLEHAIKLNQAGNYISGDCKNTPESMYIKSEMHRKERKKGLSSMPPKSIWLQKCSLQACISSVQLTGF